MVYTIKENSSTGTLLLTTSASKIDNVAPEIFFGINSFKPKDKGVWVVNKAIGREGNYAHYAGSNDREMPLEIYLYGNNRFTNRLTVSSLKDKILYIDMTDKDSDLTGTYYVIGDIAWEYDDLKRLIKATLTIAKYNN